MMERLRLKVPPTLVGICFAGGMWLLDRLLPVGEFDFFGRGVLIYILAGLSLFLGLWSVVLFGIKRTSIDPMHPDKASALVTGGPYQFSRNPQYLALLLLLLAFGLWLGNAFNTLLAAGFVSYMNRFQIVPEEEQLEQQFGSAYSGYCRLTRRWF